MKQTQSLILLDLKQDNSSFINLFKAFWHTMSLQQSLGLMELGRRFLCGMWPYNVKPLSRLK